MDDEQVIDVVTSTLLKRPHALIELYGVFEFEVDHQQLEEALEILSEAGALNERQEPIFGSLVPVYEIRKQARTDYQENR